MDTPSTAMSKAKIKLMSTPDSAFFTTICFSLKQGWDETHNTAWTDGTWMKFNPTWFVSLTPDERVFLLLHETLHVAYLHMQRKSSKDHQKWNIACDHVINLMLIERGFKMPVIGLADPQYKGMGAEEVYNLLPDNLPPPPMDDLRESNIPPDELDRIVEDILVRAQIQSKMQGDKAGSIPGDIEIFLNKILNPKLPWQTILRKYLQVFNKTDYSFKRPNRRFFPKHHLPSMYSNSLMDLVIAVDISGSVSDYDFLVFISEVHAIFKKMKPKKITLIQFDEGIQSIDEIKSLHDLSKLKFTGRGGTNITKVVEWANENKPELLMMFTDGYFKWPQLTTKANTLWFIHDNPPFTAPYGKVIHYEINKP